MTSRHLIHRLAKRTAVVVALAAIATPTASAGNVTIPAELSGRQFGPSALRVLTIPDELSGRQFGPAALPTGEIVIPPELSGRRQFGPASIPPVVIPAALSGREFGPAAFTTDIPQTVMVAAPSDGFDFRDAGVGAGITAAIALALGTVLLVTRRRDHVAPVS